MTQKVSGARLAAAALACAGLPLAACGPSSHSSAGPAPAHGAGAAGGTEGMAIDFANESGHACLMDGYPAAWFESGRDGPRVGPPAEPFAGQGGPQRVAVAAGGNAHFWLMVPTAAGWPTSSCHPVTARWVRVVPPDTSAALEVRLPYPVAVCSDPASGFNLAEMAVRGGRGIVGHTP